MQRHEIVKDALRTGVPVNVTAGDIMKYWTIDEQEHAIAKTRAQIDNIGRNIKSTKTLIEHGYPVDFVTTNPLDVDVRIHYPDEDHNSVTIQMSEKIVTMVNNHTAPIKDVVTYLAGVVDVLKVKLAAEENHLDFLREDVTDSI